MNTCKTCKHWGKSVDNKGWENWRTCDRFDEPVDTFRETPGDNLAVVWTSEWGGIYTAADFGCVQWEGKE